MNNINPNKTGLAFGAFMVLWHFCWSLLVAFGLGQAFINWIFGLHFINPPYVVTDFDILTAVILWVVVFVFGYFFGWVMARIWNWLHRA